MEDWMKKQIWLVVHLMDGNGSMLKLDESNNTYNFDCSIKNHKVTQNIPTVPIQLIKNDLDNTQTPRLQNINIDYVDFLHKRHNNKFLRQYLVNTLHTMEKLKHWLLERDS